MNALLPGPRSGPPFWLRDTRPEELALWRRLVKELEFAARKQREAKDGEKKG